MLYVFRYPLYQESFKSMSAMYKTRLGQKYEPFYIAWIITGDLYVTIIMEVIQSVTT